MTYKPFIKLFRTPNSQYFYDVGKNEIVRITSELFAYLQGLLDGVEVQLDQESQEMFDTLRNAGYLSDKHPSIIQHPYTNYLPLLLDRKIEKITLQLTQDCNFRCKYCIYSEEINTKQRSHSQKSMTWETAKKAIDFYRDHSIDSHIRNIGFYGGEPLLKFDLIKKIVEYAERALTGKHSTFSITTNGSLLTPEIISYLYRHNVYLLISLDGSKEINDKNRVFKDGSGTYDIVVKNIKRIKEQYPDYVKTIQVNMVVDTNNDLDSITTNELISFGIAPNNIFVNYIDNTDIDIPISSAFIEKMEYHTFCALISRFGYGSEGLVSHFGKSQIKTLENNIIAFSGTSGMNDIFAPSGPCIPGKIRLFINTDEELYPCERVNESPVMRIGTLDDGFDLENATNILNIGELTEDSCKNCWAIRHCTLCAKVADDGNCLSGSKKAQYCNSVINSTVQKLRSIILLKEIPEYYNHLIDKTKESKVKQ